MAAVDAQPDEEFWGPAESTRRFPLSGSVVVDVMLAALAVVVVATIAALVVLWPTGGPARSRSIAVSKTVGGQVSRVQTLRCAVAATQSCQLVTARVLSGRDRGETTTFDFLPTPGASHLAVGDRIRLLRNPPAPQVFAPSQRVSKYSFTDY